jgi:hypothetical protein
LEGLGLDYKTIKKADIDSLFNEMLSEIELNGYLDHEIRAVEKIVSDRYSDEIKATRFKIFKNQSHRAGKDTGAVFMSKNYTAILHYSSKGSHLDKILAIGHELGHIALDHVNIINPITSGIIKDVRKETQATYFAKIIAKRLSVQCTSNDLKARHFSPEDVDAAVTALGMVYDEKELT